MKFIIPKLNTPYIILQDIEVELSMLDSNSVALLHDRGISDRALTITSGSIIKIANWDYKRDKIKIRIVSTSNKSYEKICGYIVNRNWFNDLEIEEFQV